jgi:hypothetical protein
MHTMILEADNKVNLTAAQNTSTQTSTNSNSSASVGIALQLGASGGGLGVTGSVSKGGGNGSETTYTNTHVTGTDSVSIKSGAGNSGFTVNVQGNTDLKGGAITSTQAAIWYSLKPLDIFHSAVWLARQSGAHFWLKFSPAPPIP